MVIIFHNFFTGIFHHSHDRHTTIGREAMPGLGMADLDIVGGGQPHLTDTNHGHMMI